MKKIYLSMAVLMFVSIQACLAGSASYGFRVSSVTWKESEIFTDPSAKASGAMFGPSLLFKFPATDSLSLGIDGLYGALDNADRSDWDVTLSYQLAPYFTVFGEFKYLWYEYEVDKDRKSATKAPGGGLGVGLNVPLVPNGVILFANTRVLTMSVSSDEAGKGGNALMWAYEAGLALPLEFDSGAKDSNFYLAAGFRYQQMKGDNVDERAQMPFAEIGFRQEF
ncbi:MAG: hypothetical protein C0404_01590 [Verrucomicrobia bacterium]|nr:hypothetical protein [Verrucomicrobiota bacterium]